MWLLEIIAIAFGCIGVIMISNPLLFGNILNQREQSNEIHLEHQHPMAWLGIAMGLAYGLS